VSLGIVYEFDSFAPARSTAVLATLQQFVSVLRLGDTVFLTAYTRKGSVTADFIPATSELLRHFSGTGPGGPANLYDVLYAAADKLRDSPNLKRTLLVISDGTDGSGEHRVHLSPSIISVVIFNFLFRSYGALTLLD
jgi:hypothetical protein